MDISALQKYKLRVSLTLTLVGVMALVCGAVFYIFPTAFALNDTTKTWTFDAAESTNYTFDATLMSVDGSGAHPLTAANKLTNPSYSSDAASWGISAIPAAGWAEVPGNVALYSTGTFLVMQYEAKAWDTQTNAVVSAGGNGGPGGWAGANSQTRYQARSISAGKPWVNLAQSEASEFDAIEACSALGSSYHLITNNEWMTIARNLEQVPSNWTGASVGTGLLFRGNSDGASSLDGSTVLTGVNTRTHTLSTGGVMWDLAGNVTELTNNTILRRQQPVAWNGTSDDASGFNQSDFAVGSLSRYIHTWKVGSPLQQVDTSPSNSSWNANQGMGRIYHYSSAADTDSTVYVYLRGASWTGGTFAGVYSLQLNSATSLRDSAVGFRCATNALTNSLTFSAGQGRTGGGNTVVVDSLADAKIIQAVNVGSTDTFDFSVYVKDSTSGNVGGAVSSAVAELYYDGAAIATTYTDAGAGWWKLSATVTGANQVKDYGLLIQSGSTIVLDDWTLAKQAEYSVYTTTAYHPGELYSWDSLAITATTPGSSTIVYQLCHDDGSVCQAGSSWQYWDGDSWETAANSTSHANSAAQLTDEVIQAFPITNQKLSVKAIMTFAGSEQPSVTSIVLGLSTDTTAPPTNASALTMKSAIAGSDMTSGQWTNGSSPYFSWAAGEDNVGGSGIRGYCLYLGTDAAADPSTTKGLLGTSPGSTNGSTCQFVVTTTSVDFANVAYRGASWLTSDTLPYYLHVKAIDNSGRVFAGSSTSFEFKFDNTAPTNVAYISPASGSFSNVSDMNFSWPISGGSSSSDAHSQLLGWQYQINSSTGSWLGTQTDPTTGVSYIPTSQSSYVLTQLQDGGAIVTGNNVIYFRSVDTAGNSSSDATMRTGNLSYGGEAPAWSGAEAVTVSPTVSDTNSFALSWPAAVPTVGQTVAGYYFMINTPPPSTYATLADNTLTYIPAGTSTSVALGSLSNVNKGTNTVYVVAVDNASTPNYSPSNFISGTFVLNSTDPDNVGNLSSSDSSIKSQSQWNVTLTWTVPTYKGAGNLNYLVLRSSDASTFTQVGTTTGLSYVDTTPESAKYYYKIVTKDGADATSTGSSVVTIKPTGKWTSAPSLESGPTVSTVTTKKAKVSWTTSRTSDSKVSFGTKTGEYNTEEPSNSSQVNSHVINITNLSPGTTYYYKAKWTDEDGNTGSSEEKSFTTAPAPTVKDVVARNFGLTSGIIQFTSTGASKVKIYYGTSTSFGSVKEVPTSTDESNYTTEISDLNDGTKYYFKINTFDSEGSEYEGTVLDFSTLPRPLISNVRLEQVANTAETTVRVSWTSNTNISSILTFYPEARPQDSRDVVNVNLENGPHMLMVRGLLPQTAYRLVVSGRDSQGNEASSDSQLFTTATDTRPAQITDLKVTNGVLPSAGAVAGEVRVQLVVTWNTDELATSQVEFGEGTGATYAQRSQEDGNLTTNHTVILSNLTPSQVYHLRAVSKDPAGNISTSIDTISIAPKATQSALDLVLKNLSEAFGGLRSLR